MLLDTSGLLCYYHAGEPQHADARTFFKAATQRLTHSYVLAEFVPLCHVRGLRRRRVLAFAEDLLVNPQIEIVWVDGPLHRLALALLKARLDKTYSLCDAVSFLLMQQRGITEALTTDRHFEQAGFVRLLKP
jgi:predicted nucleic acid-binding protein